MLNYLLDSYKYVKNAIKYDRESLSSDDVIPILRVRKLEIKAERSFGGNGDGLYVKAKPEKKYIKKGKDNHKKQHHTRRIL